MLQKGMVNTIAANDVITKVTIERKGALKKFDAPKCSRTISILNRRPPKETGHQCEE
jgi:hypothetical protein